MTLENKVVQIRNPGWQRILLRTAVFIITAFLTATCSPRVEPELPDYIVLPDGSKLIENQVFNRQVNLVGEEYSNLTIRNCVIEDLPKNHSGLYLRGVHDVLIENCTIRNLRGIRGGNGRGIRLSALEENTNITIRGCTIETVESDGISIPQRSGGDSPVKNRGVRIINNTIRQVASGQRLLKRGLLHGIYCQGEDYVIEGNTIHTVGDGNGISVRTSGVIRGNTVYNVGAGDPIRYFNDHPWESSRPLLIENNICYDESYEQGQRGMVRLSYDPLHPSYRGNKFIIRFNTLVSLHDQAYAISVDEAYTDAEVLISGNLLVSPNGQYIDGPASLVNANYTTRVLDDFVSSRPPYNFHVTGEHNAVGYASHVSEWPMLDIDGELREAGKLDAGADQHP